MQICGEEQATTQDERESRAWWDGRGGSPGLGIRKRGPK